MRSTETKRVQGTADPIQIFPKLDHFGTGKNCENVGNNKNKPIENPKFVLTCMVTNMNCTCRPLI